MAISNHTPASRGSTVPDRLSATLALDEPVGRVRLVSPTRASVLAKLGIGTVRDLVTHFPRRYIDLSQKKTVTDAVVGEQCTIEGVVHDIVLKRPRPRLDLVEISLVDETGLLMVTAFRQPWLADRLKKDMRVAVAGKLEFNYGFKRMVNPYIEQLQPGQDAEGMIVPVHPASEKLSAAMMRRLIGNALETVRGCYDPLPLDLRVKYRLMSRNAALQAIHFPVSMDEAHAARRRLAYEEVLLLQLLLMSDNVERSLEGEAVSHVVDGPCSAALALSLPFELTDEQKSALEDIRSALFAPAPMNHMLLGDVGTGKTVVAASALCAVADTGTQAILMAPTEVLACQHAKSLGGLFDQVGVSWGLLTGSTKPSERKDLLERFAAGNVDVLIGTHAVLEDDVTAPRVSFVVIDEQQRFGVEQRAKLLGKGSAPDALFLTATPIPRTLALAVFGNLTLSYLHARPHASAVRTTFVHTREDKGRAYDAAREAVANGQQVFVVCPLVGQDSKKRDKRAAGVRSREIDEEAVEYAAISIEFDGDLQHENMAAATKEAQYLQSTVFPDYRVDLLHGRMSSAEKQQTMRRFASGESQVLVATTVIEVGVDVPNATVMIVEDADRFGLSQLHQLRGRVGRGTLPAQVHLISASKNPVAVNRLEAMVKTDDGFELAMYDLSLRREGDILGNRQSGASGLKLVNIVRDKAIIETAHRDACDIMENDPQLECEEHRALARELRSERARVGSVQGG